MTIDLKAVTPQPANPAALNAYVAKPAAEPAVAVNALASPHVQAPVQTTAAPNALTEAQKKTNIQEAVESLNRHMQETGRNLNFSVDEASKRLVITVKDATTGEVLRQIPDESLLRVAHNIEDMKGLMHNATT